jgi:hypothetical protein
MQWEVGMSPTPAGFDEIFATLKQLFRPHLDRLSVQSGSATEYMLIGRKPSPFPQHKGHPMHFGSVRLGKAYVSFHLMPLYMNEALSGTISPALRKRMQGKTCFNFKTAPDAALLAELERLIAAGLKFFDDKNWV